MSGGLRRIPAAGAALVLAVAWAGCGGTRSLGEHTPFAGCARAPTEPPVALGLDAFYAKYLDGFGTPVVASAAVRDEALVAACRITGELVAARADVRAALTSSRFHVAVLAEGEQTTDIPEYADLYAVFPGTDWNAIRGLGATRARPVSSGAEENLLCLPGDVYPGEALLMQMAAHGVRDLGIEAVDPQFSSQLRAAYAAAMERELWAGSWAASDAEAYWAIGTQAWFGASQRLPVASRSELASYDAPLAALLAAYLPADEWRPSCY